MKTFGVTRRSLLRTERFIKELMHNKPEKPITNGFGNLLCRRLYTILYQFNSDCPMGRFSSRIVVVVLNSVSKLENLMPNFTKTKG